MTIVRAPVGPIAPTAPASEGGSGRPAEIVAVLERLLVEQQELVLRLEALAGDRGGAADSERTALRRHMAFHATDIDRLFAELGAIEPPDGPPLAEARA